MNKPNAFLIGAPKCGTTSLMRWLSFHPEVFVSSIKEPYYFADDLNIGQVKGIDDYECLFKSSQSKHKVIIEGSTGYLYSRNAVKNIIEYCDEPPKFIIMLRNPIEMSVSLHSQIYYMGWDDIDDFEKAWDLQYKRKCGYFIPNVCKEPKVLYYKDWCMLGEQLKRFIALVEDKGVSYHIMWIDDLRLSPAIEYRKLMNFLGIDSSIQIEFDVLNEAKTPKSNAVNRLFNMAYLMKKKLNIQKNFGLTKINSQIKTKKDISLYMRKLLVSEFKDDICLLGQLTNRDLRKWVEL